MVVSDEYLNRILTIDRLQPLVQKAMDIDPEERRAYTAATLKTYTEGRNDQTQFKEALFIEGERRLRDRRVRTTLGLPNDPEQVREIGNAAFSTILGQEIGWGEFKNERNSYQFELQRNGFRTPRKKMPLMSRWPLKYLQRK